MAWTTLSSRELNRDVSNAKKAAQDGPVVITDRGKPSHVLMTYGEFQRLSGKRRSLVEARALPRRARQDFGTPRAALAPPQLQR